MRRSKIFFAILGFSFLGAGLPIFAEEKPAVASVHPPRMPTIQSVKTPTFGGGFYVPKIDDFYQGATIRNSPKSPTPTDSTEPAKKTTEQTLTEKLNEISNLSQSANSILSAQDLSMLDSMGNLSSVSSLLAKNKNLSAISTLSSGDITSADNTALLNQILAELKTMKEETPRATEISVSLNSPVINETPVKTREKDDSKILRFVVNGYNLLATCKTIYFSDKESDGTFLLTGDRIYNSNNQSRTETFYMLFKAVGNEGGVTTYKVAPDVTQDYENKYSFLYQLSNKENLVAEKTGNLISLKVKEPAWNMDLLIDAGVE